MCTRTIPYDTTVISSNRSKLSNLYNVDTIIYAEGYLHCKSRLALMMKANKGQGYIS